MMPSLFSQGSIFLAFDNPFAKLGVTSWEPLASSALAFIVAALILHHFALKPLQKMLDERKKRIEEGEAMRAKSEATLRDIEKRTEELLDKARTEGARLINEAKSVAAKNLEDKQTEAARLVEEILQKSREAAALEAENARTELRQEFARLVGAATAQVTGKILTDSDRQTIEQDTIDSL